MVRRVVPLVLLLAGCATSQSMIPTENTREAVIQYVNNAAAIVARDGPSCPTFGSKDWMSGSWYIFVLGPDNRLVCHPTADLVGKPYDEITDATGKRVGEAIVAAANSNVGHGWVDYVWPKPGETTPWPKSTYAVRVIGPDDKQYIVGSGAYDLY